MEYLVKIKDNLKTISEQYIKYVNIFESTDLVYGAPFWEFGEGFRKYSSVTSSQIENLSDKNAKREFENLKRNTSGCFLRFQTEAEKLILKAQVRRRFDYKKMNLYDSSGFDVYEVDNGKYMHIGVYAPTSGKDIFAIEFLHKPGTEIVIYLPLYNEVLALYIGAAYPLKAVQTVDGPPVIFYGNSITQGASASRSGNSFCNIVSRRLNKEIYNYSVSSCCKGFLSVADTIGKLNASAIIIDYSRNAYSVKGLKNYQDFYYRIRKKHPNIPIIFMTTSNFSETTEYDGYDDIIYATYKNAKEMQHKVAILNQKALFSIKEYDLISVDGIHYSDMGMYKIANELCRLLDELWKEGNGFQ